MLVNPKIKLRGVRPGKDSFKTLPGAKVCVPETVLFHKGKPELLVYTEKGVLMATRNPNKLALKEVAKVFNDIRARRK